MVFPLPLIMITLMFIFLILGDFTTTVLVVDRFGVDKEKNPVLKFLYKKLGGPYGLMAIKMFGFFSVVINATLLTFNIPSMLMITAGTIVGLWVTIHNTRMYFKLLNKEKLAETTNTQVWCLT